MSLYIMHNNIAFIFPGQGTQYVGMAKDFVDRFPAAKEVFEEASDSLGFDIFKLCSEGPQEELFKTENTQPSVLTASVAILKVIERAGFDCSITAGLSLGEYTSLVKAGALRFDQCVNIVKNRGRYMQEAVPIGAGKMAAILGLEKHEVELCLANSKEYGVVEIANINAPGQIVISGEKNAVKESIKEAKRSGAKKAVLLPVSAPFHSSLLLNAGEKLKKDFSSIEVNTPIIPVVANYNARIVDHKEEVVPLLIKQVSSTVLWQGSVELMINKGINVFIEIGPGKVLSPLVQKIAENLNLSIKVYNVENISDYEELMQIFGGEA